MHIELVFKKKIIFTDTDKITVYSFYYKKQGKRNEQMEFYRFLKNGDTRSTNPNTTNAIPAMLADLKIMP